MKHKLHIDSLSVESFQAVADVSGARGTVRANASDPNTCYPVICASGEWSCLDTCQDTCGLSCHGTCVPAQCTGEES